MKTLANTLIASVTPALLLGLSGCSIYVHGKSEGHAGDGSKTAGAEHAHAKPAHKPEPHAVQVAPKPAHDTPKPAPVPAPAPHATGHVDAGGALGGGKVPPGPDHGKPALDVSGISAGVKPVKPVKPVDTGAVSGGVKPIKPVDTGAVSGGVKPSIDASGVLAGGAVTPVKKPGALDNSQILGAGGVKPAMPVDASGTGGKVGTRSPESIAAEKLAAEGKSERGDRELPSGSVASGEKKPPTPTPATKDKGSNPKPALQLPKPVGIKAADGSAVAMIPEHGEGKGQMRTPVVVTSISCSLPSKELNQGEKFRLNGRGFADGVKVTVGGIAVPVTATKPTQIDAQLPKELANGGEVAISQGNVVATCGKLTIKASK